MAEKEEEKKIASPDSSRSLTPEVEKIRMADQSGSLTLSRIGSDVAATYIVCCGVGWYIDQSFGTQPWGLVAAAFLGTIVASVNVVRLACGYDNKSLGWREEKKESERRK